MKNKTRIGIVGYGNLGKAAEINIAQQEDLELVCVFSRRNPEHIPSKVSVYPYEAIPNFKDKIDVMLLCGGSAKDLPVQSLEIAQYFNTVDSFDNHAEIPKYFEALNNVAQTHNTLSMLSTGWDPGLFSMMRLLGESILPKGKTYTFWGKGLSQGHSDAIRRIEGVKYAAQYTLPDEKVLEEVRAGKLSDFQAQDMHQRICYVVLDTHGDAPFIEKEIKTMPNYFEPYYTEVHFISEKEFISQHQHMSHGGKVLRSGFSSENTHQLLEFNLKLDSNPEFTSSVLVAYARGVHALYKDGKKGAISVFDMPLGYLSPKSASTLRKELL